MSIFFIFVKAYNNFIEKSKDLSNELKLKYELLDLKHFIIENFSCDATRSQNDFACGSSSPQIASTYKRNGQLLTKGIKTGSHFRSFQVWSECLNNEFYYYYKNDKLNDLEKNHLYGGVPIVCNELQQTNVALGISYEDWIDDD